MISLAHISPHHLEDLQESGLTEETILKAGLRSVSDRKEVQDKLNGIAIPAGVLPALEFPYQDLEPQKRRAPYSRFKFATEYVVRDLPSSTNDHCKAVNSSADTYRMDHPKYMSPAERGTRLYIQTIIQPDIMNPQKTLYLVEGEKKALAACQAGLAAVGLPGVNCFFDSASGLASKGMGGNSKFLHPDFGLLKLEDRKVVIVFDSDIDSNPRVLQAAATLGQMLNEACADVGIVYLDGPVSGVQP
jgi:hypothetical protein